NSAAVVECQKPYTCCSGGRRSPNGSVSAPRPDRLDVSGFSIRQLPRLLRLRLKEVELINFIIVIVRRINNISTLAVKKIIIRDPVIELDRRYDFAIFLRRRHSVDHASHGQYT